MNKFEPSPNPSPNPKAGHDTPDNTRVSNPTGSETSQRQKRPRAPQFGTDRRNPRDTDARRPKKSVRAQDGQRPGAPDGLPQNAGSDGQSTEKRKAAQDRRQSYSRGDSP